MSRPLLSLVAVALVSSLAVGCGGSDAQPQNAQNAQPQAGNQAPASKDVVDTAVGAGSFTKLAAALGAADLVSTLKGPGPFTVFAPTDEAFAKLPAGALEDLLKPENKAKLAAVLSYHVVSGKVGSEDVVKVSRAKSVQGKELSVKVDGGSVSIDDAKVVKADIECSNGVIHVIDKVLLP